MSLQDVMEAANKVLLSGALTDLSPRDASLAASFVLCSVAKAEHARTETLLTLDEYFYEVLLSGLVTFVWPAAKRDMVAVQ